MTSPTGNATPTMTFIPKNSSVVNGATESSVTWYLHDGTTKMGGVTYSRDVAGTGNYTALYVDTVALRAISSATEGSTVQIWKDATPSYAAAIGARCPAARQPTTSTSRTTTAPAAGRSCSTARPATTQPALHLQIPIYSANRSAIRTVNNASQAADPIQVLASNGSTVLAKVSSTGAITAASPLTLGSNHITFGSAAPSSGTWGQGDVCFNTAVTATTTPGWSCTTGGTPGTWTAWPVL